MTDRELAQAIVEEMAAVAASMLGGEPAIETEEEGLSSIWAMHMSASGPLVGSLTLGITSEDASKLAGLVMGFDEPPAEDIVTDSLQEMAQQVASAVSVKHGPPLKVVVSGPVESVPAAPGGSEWSAVVLGELRTRLVIWYDLSEAQASAAPPTPTPRAEAPAQIPVLAAPVRPVVPSSAPNNLDLILDIELPLWVRFGETAMTLQALTKLGPGTTLDLERSPDDPVDVMVNNTVIARGEVVVVAGNYGVRVTEVVSTTDRIRSMAG